MHVSPLEQTIKSIADLAGQTAIKYGVVKDGLTHQLIANSTHPVIRRLTLDNVDSQREGVERVRRRGTGQGREAGEAGYAFILEEGTAEYWMLQHCELTIVPMPELAQRTYALALSKNSLDTSKVRRRGIGPPPRVLRCSGESDYNIRPTFQ